MPVAFSATENDRVQQKQWVFQQYKRPLLLKFMNYQARTEAGLIISMAMNPISHALLLKRPFY